MKSTDEISNAGDSFESMLSEPTCCGKKMGIKSDTGKFIEAWCSACEGVAYIKNRFLN